MLNLGRLCSRFIRLGLLTLLVVTTGAVSAGPQVSALLVCPQGCPFTSIQWAIDSAPEGATIIVGPGTYKENLLIEKSITIIGSGPEVTRIEGWQDDLPAIRILGDREGFSRLAYGEEEEWASFLTVNLYGLEVVFMVEPKPALQCLSLIGRVGELDGEDCSAEVFIRGPVRFVLGESRLVSGTTPPERPPLGGVWAVLADVTVYSTHVRGNWVNLVFERSRVTLLNNLIEESFAPDPYESESVGIALFDSHALLYRNRVVNNLNGIGTYAEIDAVVTLIENEVHANHGAGISIQGSGVKVQLLRNVVTGSQGGLVVEAESVAGIVVCEGNRFEGNEHDIFVTNPRGYYDPEASEELARRCEVELGEGGEQN